MGKVFGWLGRKAALYVALVAALALGTFVGPWVKQLWVGQAEIRVRSQVLAAAARTLASERAAATSSFEQTTRALRTTTVGQLDQRQRALNGERDRLAQVVNAARPAWVLAVLDRHALMDVERKKLRMAVIDQELAAISAARNAAASNGASLLAQANVAAQDRQLSRLVAQCDAAGRSLGAFEQRWRWKLRQWWDSDAHKALVSRKNSLCGKAQQVKAGRNRMVQLAQARAAASRRAQEAFARAASDTDIIQHAGVDLASEAKRAGGKLARGIPARVRVWSEQWKLAELLRTAAFALAVIIATPFLIRLFCYFVLAPLAMRRPAIRLRVPEGQGARITPSAPSATSVPVRLARGEELLVRQDYLQTSSHAGAKGTQWLLDWRKPVTSFLTGLTFLTRIRGEGETTTVSATRDGLAEVTILTLPEGASCVLQPRALAAVAQPIGRPLRITRHWRLGSLNAWLTLQLRYLVFHGPARLVLKGGRGVRVEAAEQGRAFGQDQLLGFSADLAYSVTRAETFWPYFLGREQLLKDRVMAGAGVLIVEEAPLSSRRGEVRRGLEGMIDAGMKVFGL